MVAVTIFSVSRSAFPDYFDCWITLFPPEGLQILQGKSSSFVSISILLTSLLYVYCYYVGRKGKSIESRDRGNPQANKTGRSVVIISKICVDKTDF